MFKSGLYEGTVRHRRFEPISHAFSYKLFMMYLDLDELDDVFADSRIWSHGKRNLAWFKRADYLRPVDIPLREAVARCVKDKVGRETSGPIRILTNLRYCGFCYNPVSFYYCFDQSGDKLEHIIAEINNTPWNERFQYVLVPPDPNSNTHKFEFEKIFHVSPFMPMDMKYQWGFSTPDEQLNIHMENHKEGKKYFDATLNLDRTEITPASLRRAFWRYPLMTVKVHAAIYWNALHLWRKKAGFHAHPKKLQPREA